MGLTFKLGTAPQVTTNYIPKANSNSFSNSLIFDNGTNIGIGTTSPDTLLHLSATQGTSKIASTSTSAANAPYLTFFHAGNDEFRISGGDGLRFLSSGTTERMRITGAGNVGIGTTSTGFNVAGLPLVIGSGSGNTGMTIFSGNTSSGSIHFADTETTGAGSYSGFINYDHTANSMQFGTTNTERMRITSDGRLCLNTTAAIAAGRFNIVDDCNSTTPIEIKDTAASNSGAFFVRFVNNSNVVCGSIAHQTSTTTQFNTSSDYRLKKDLKDYNGLDVVSKIKTYDFEWIEDGKRMYGVLAHELAEIIPYAVNGEKDGEQMQGADYSKIVPVLVKAIQELNAKVSALENKS
jgi:hypothetical protein